MKKRALIPFVLVMLLLHVNSLFAQHEIRIQGIVRDLATNKPIFNVQVLHNGNTITYTDIDGKYSCFVPSNAKLLFYNPEYNDYEVSVDNRQIINVSMTEKLIELSEAIIVGTMSKKTIVVDQTELEVIGNHFHLKTKFRVPKQIFTADKRFIVQPSLHNVTRSTVEYFRPVVIDGSVYDINRQRISGFSDEDEDVLKPYVIENTLGKTGNIYSYHDSIFVSREYFNNDFKAECYLAVNANFENVKRDFLDTVTIARGTQNPLRFLDYKLAPIDLVDTSLIPKPEMKLVASKGISQIGFLVGRAEIDKNNPQNEVELNAIKDKLNAIVNDRFATLNSITVIGYASPDGVYRNNAILAQKRTDYMLKEILQALPAEIRKYIKVNSMSVVEPWSNLIPLLRADSLPQADYLQDLVTKHKDNYAPIHAQMLRLPEYRPLIYNQYLTKLRRVEYEINHSMFRNLTVPEIWERYNSGEKDISRHEYWQMVESSPDSLTKVKMERLALSEYPNFVLLANREAKRLIQMDSVDFSVLGNCMGRGIDSPMEVRYNQTLMALNAGEIEMADSLNRYIPDDDPRVSQLKAIVNTMSGHYDRAYPYMASKGGLNEVLILLCMGRNEEADKKMTILIEDEANWGKANYWYVKAICSNRLEDLSWAMTAMEQAIALDPDLIETARLDSDVMDIIDILVPKDENNGMALEETEETESDKKKKNNK